MKVVLIEGGRKELEYTGVSWVQVDGERWDETRSSFWLKFTDDRNDLHLDIGHGRLLVVEPEEKQ